MGRCRDFAADGRETAKNTLLSSQRLALSLKGGRRGKSALEEIGGDLLV